MYRYYRCMSMSEYSVLNRQEETYSQVTWWAMSKGDAMRYMSEGKVVVCITLSTPIPAYYNAVAEYIGATPHLEIKISGEEFNKHIAKTLEEVELV